jgi:hypothetical protein
LNASTDQAIQQEAEMRTSLFGVALVVVIFGQSGFTQEDKTASPPIAMPADRQADSYRIYSSLIPLGETAGKDWPHDLWLVQDATITTVPSDQQCSPPPGANELLLGMNPHFAVHAPDNQLQDYLEIMRDFDAHCHDRLRLDADGWNLKAPVHLLTPQEQEEFRKTRSPEFKDSAAAAKFKGAPAIYGFSEVYFNAPHTVALVYATHWCGGLCGQGFWVAFALQDGEWKELRWNSASWIS